MYFMKTIDKAECLMNCMMDLLKTLSSNFVFPYRESIYSKGKRTRSLGGNTFQEIFNFKH